MSEPWKHHAKVVNGFRMHYVIAGSGYPLVLLHGWPQSWYEWRKIIPALAEKFTELPRTYAAWEILTVLSQGMINVPSPQMCTSW